MKYFIIVFSFLFISQFAFSQDKKNIISSEVYLVPQDFLDGDLNYQLTYERVFVSKKKERTKMVSVGLIPSFNDDGGVYIFSLGYHRLYRPEKKNQFEHAFRFHYRIEDFQGNIYHDPVALMIYGGYRYQMDNGLMFKAGGNLIISFPIGFSPTLGLGYRF